jgi:uncharacterized protein YrrD
MLDKAKTLKGYKLHTLDGEIGKVEEFYFDDQYWTIRYLVANTGNWLQGTQVLISPYALAAVSREKKYIAIDLTKKQIEDSPSLNSDEPVSRHYELGYYKYYGYPMYWGGPNMWGKDTHIVRDREQWTYPAQSGKAWNPHLRSTRDVSGHQVQATDGEIGHVDDFVVDDDTWAIRYLVIDTRNWRAGKKVLISPLWIKRVSWKEEKVFVNVLRETIQQAPEYSEEALLTRDYETRLHGHYNRPGYWVNEAAGMKPSC